ncbi:class I SAM-dependent methyltransferase [Thiorhodovibrio frisius]|uniref:O-methyltransferase n=1 Tax=Thiorhodovibrio frisius TaxID=631362 RepID=H8Z1W1_9GAMM|nr:class I SAM-dependent methyltransferase [Thiorhodovibrio frisius]EIC22589.1 hypothetical protein Thi970DRAFT_02861 [Thiorhodovibrio frisius]WPL20030.1 hypothetical protein Thiofri_00081 [Thiorhodovibrio frisius]
MNIIKKLSAKSWRSEFFNYNHTLVKNPTMLTVEECRMLAYLTANIYNGGEIVELGSFLGGSTAHLASGLSLKKIPSSSPLIKSYDFFEMQEKDKTKYTEKYDLISFDGTNTLEIVKEMLGSHASYVEFFKGDILDSAYEKKQISILFNDAAKSYELNEHIINTFFPKLEPGSVLIQQDYLHYTNPWVIASMELMEEYFHLVSWTEYNSVLFVCKKNIPTNPIKNFETIRTSMEFLLAQAIQKFTDVRQREAIAKSILGFRQNTNVEKSWAFNCAFDAKAVKELIA